MHQDIQKICANVCVSHKMFAPISSFLAKSVVYQNTQQSSVPFFKEHKKKLLKQNLSLGATIDKFFVFFSLFSMVAQAIFFWKEIPSYQFSENGHIFWDGRYENEFKLQKHFIEFEIDATLIS